MSAAGWSIEQTIPTLAVGELETAIAFYERLGFSVDWRWPEEKPTHAGLLHGSAALMLCECEPAERGDIYYIVSDVEACFADVLQAKPWELAAETKTRSTRDDCPPARSLQPPKPPHDQTYGLRDFAIIDPWGHQLSFGEPINP